MSDPTIPPAGPEQTPPPPPAPYGAPVYNTPGEPYGAPAAGGPGAADPGSGAPGGPNGPGAGGYGGAPAPGTTYNVLAIVSLVTAFFISLAAVITGHIALGQIKRTGEKGRGLALAGVILGYAGLVLGAIALVVVLVIFLTIPGALSTTDPDPFDDDPFSTSESTSGTSDEATDAATDDAGSLGDDLTFDAGSTLSASSVLQFTDPYLTDTANWTVAQADDGNGNWSYTAVATGCTLSFYQGLYGDAATAVPGDDRATTDNYLGYYVDATEAEIAEYAGDDYFNQGLDGLGYVDARSILITYDDGTSSVTMARAFTQPQSVLLADLTCPAGVDAGTEIFDATSDLSVVVG